MGEEDETTTFGAADYAVFVVMLVVSALIGIYYRFTGNRQRTAREYLVADKNMSVVPVAFSLMASFMSAVTLLGVPSENYFFGTQFVLIIIAYLIGTPIAAYLFLPVFYELQVISVYEYVERRFGRATRLAMSATFIIQMVLYMAVVLYAPAVALSAVTGIPKWLCIISVGLVCTFYCTIGGMKAVLWTDLFQSILMFAAMFAVVGVGAHRMGGISNVWAEAEAGGRIEFLNFDPDPTVRHTVWTLAIGNIFVFVSIYGVNQAQVQRLMTVGSLKKAQMALYLNAPALSGLCLITSLAGVVMYANFRHCDPLLSGKITKTDQSCKSRCKKMGDEDARPATFGAADYAVFGVMLLLSSLIGIYYRFTGGRQRTVREYLVADRKMSVVTVAFSLMASFLSAITLLGVPAENYYYGTHFAVVNIAYILGTFIAAFVFLPVFYDLQVISVYEYLERRFGKATRLAASVAFIIQMVLYTAVMLYAPAVALTAVTGISKWLSTISVGLVATFYCTIGGMKAVLWTDLFQSILMFLVVFAVVGVGTYRMGGVYNVWSEAQAGGRIEFLNFDPDPTVRHSVWALAVGGTFMYVSIYGVNQFQVQRLMTVSTLKKAQTALFLNLPIVSALCLMSCFAGIVIYANFRHCDPLLSGKITNTDQVLPYFVMLYLGGVQGVPGLIVAGIFSGALSTVSSAVNSMAAVLLEDFVRPFCISEKTYDKHALVILKFLAISYGILCVLITGAVEHLGGVLQLVCIVSGMAGGPLLGVFTLGMLCRTANQKAALSGLIAGLVIGFWVGIGAMAYGLKPPLLPLLDDGCQVSSAAASALTTPAVSDVLNNVTATLPTILARSQLSGNVTTTTDVIIGETYVSPLHRLSYMWYYGVGWMVTVVVGFVVTLLTGGAKDVDPRCLSSLVRNRSVDGRGQLWSLGRTRNPLATSSQVLPYFVMLHLGFVKGLPGLFVAGIFSGSLSTVSSAVNSLVAVLLEDFLRPICISQKTYDSHAPLILKILAFFFGILCVLLTAVVEQLGGVLYAGFIIFGVVGGPVLGVFTLGLFCRKANQKGALLGLMAGLVMCFWIAIGATLHHMQPKPLPLLVDGCRTSSEYASAVNITDMHYDRSDCNVTSTVATILVEGTMAANRTSSDLITDDTYVLPLYRLSYQWYSGLGWLIVVVVGSLVALLTRGADDVDPRLLSPLIRNSTERHKMSLSRPDDPLLTDPQVPMKVIKNSIPA